MCIKGAVVRQEKIQTNNQETNVKNHVQSIYCGTRLVFEIYDKEKLLQVVNIIGR